MNTITRDWLLERHACIRQVNAFCKLWPDGVELTKEVAERAYEAGLYTVWVACHLMTPAQRRQFTIFVLRQHQPCLVELLNRGARDAVWGTAKVTAWVAAWAVAEATAEAVAGGVAEAWATVRREQYDYCMWTLMMA